MQFEPATLPRLIRDALAMGAPVIAMLSPGDPSDGHEPVFVDMRPWMLTAGADDIRCALAAAAEEADPDEALARASIREEFDAFLAFTRQVTGAQADTSLGLDGLAAGMFQPTIRGHDPNVTRLLQAQGGCAVLLDATGASAWIDEHRPDCAVDVNERGDPPAAR